MLHFVMKAISIYVYMLHHMWANNKTIDLFKDIYILHA